MTPKELAELDLAVAKAEHPRMTFAIGADGFVHEMAPCHGGMWEETQWLFKPTRDGAEAMRLLEKFKMDLDPVFGTGGEMRWRTRQPFYGVTEVGETPAIAICKAVVALKEKS